MKPLHHYDDFNNAFEFGEEFELEDMDNYREYPIESEEVYSGSVNEGGDLPADGYIVYYQHHMYMNYAYKIESIESVSSSQNKTFSDLRNDRDSTFATYAYIANDLDELAEDFRTGRVTPFDKINSGSRIVKEFLAEQGHPDYV